MRGFVFSTDNSFELVTGYLTGTDQDGVFDFSAVDCFYVNIKAMGGNDLIVVQGSGHLFGGDGNDTIRGGEISSSLNGGAGGDELYGGACSDSFYVDDGNDRLFDSGVADRDRVIFTSGSFHRLNLQQDIGWAYYVTFDKATLAGTDGNDVINLASTTIQVLSGVNADMGAGNDRLIGTSLADTLNGGAGADKMRGGLGNDIYYIDDANDFVGEKPNGGADLAYVSATSIVIPAQVETLALLGDQQFTLQGNRQSDRVLVTGDMARAIVNGSFGSDVMTVLTAEAIVNGNGGNDILWSGKGNDQLYGGADNDKIYGDLGDDLMSGGSGMDSLFGGAGNDTFDGGSGNDAYSYDEGDDLYLIEDGDRIDGTINDPYFKGNDTIQSSSVDIAQNWGSVGNANVFHSTAAQGVHIVQYFGTDVLIGSDYGDTIDGGDSDTLIGGTGSDTYTLTSMNVLVLENPRSGFDQINLVLADNAVVNSYLTYQLPDNVEGVNIAFSRNGWTVLGNDADNVITMFASMDNTIDGGRGADTMDGGAGNDTYYVDSVGDRIADSGYGTEDAVHVYLARYTLPDTVEILFGRLGRNSVLTGNASNNIIFGNVGDDVLSGLDGDDSLVGVAGHDTLTGGAGADAFVYGFTPLANSADQITDFEHGVDSVLLSAADGDAFAGLPLNALAPGAFRLGGAALDSDDRILYNTATGDLLFDVDGNGVTAPVLIARLTSVPALTAVDFWVI